MAKKIFRNTFIITLDVILVASMLIMAVFYQAFDTRVQKELSNSAELVTQALKNEPDKLSYLNNLQLEGMRVTWVAADGKVLFDNVAIAAQMENHKLRPEIAQAMQSGVGISSRYSATLSEKTLYYALMQGDGTVIRLSSTQMSIWGTVLGLLPAFAAISFAVLILSSVMSSRLAKRALMPINTLDLENPMDNDVYEELSPLLNRISQQNFRISLQMSELAKRQEELTVITDHMSEGLVMLSSQQHILAINLRARKLFSVTAETCIGKHVLMLCRDKELETVVQRASRGDNAETLMEISGRVYQLLASPVLIESKQVGSVLLILDITEKADAERIRREFSANVSHELKTPLTSISGYAEIMKNGLAKQEDMVEFAGRIYDESNRLISLVEDIIRLSKLDEGNIDMEKEYVDIHALSQSVVQRLYPLADQFGITVEVHGKEQFVFGVRAILDEMIYNLCENAIKYNKRGGRVDIEVGDDSGDIQLVVKDTGIGIAPSLQDKVFERFYRVDKSHSRETGGTGLGLSIVKHGARFHNARILLSSTVGLGTEIKLIFPDKAQ